MASRIAKTPLVQLQRHLAAQAAPAAAAAKKPADGIEVRRPPFSFQLELAPFTEKQQSFRLLKGTMATRLIKPLVFILSGLIIFC